jgi:hypothetical protein
MNIPPRYDQKILLYGMQRSGSTLMWMILEKILNREIFKTHTYIPAPKTIITYRDPRDIASSIFRLSKNMGNGFTQENTIIPFKKKYWAQTYSLVQSQINIFLQYKNTKKGDYLFLKYEEFFEDFDNIFNQLSTFLGISITTETKNYIMTHFNINNNKLFTDELTQNQRDKLRGKKNIKKRSFLPQHIFNGEISTWKKFVPIEEHENFNNYFSQQLNLMDYDN